MGIRSARGKKGIVLWDGKRTFVRIDDEDYYLLSDMEVIITDDDCYIYETKKILDYSPRTFGHPGPLD